VAPDAGEQPAAVEVLDYPALAIAAGEASRAGRRGHTRLVLVDLALLAAAGLVGGASPLLASFGVGWERALAAVLLTLALFAMVATRLRAYDTQWFDGRAVAETVKSATWRYAMRASPYDADNAAAKSP